MNPFSDYSNNVLANGNTEWSQLQNGTQNYINQYFNESPTAQSIVTQNSIPISARTETISNVRMRLSKSKDDYRKILFPDINHIVKKGDIFSFQGYDWICIDKNSSSSSNICIVTKCNYPLKWIDENKDIQTQNAVVINLQTTALGIDNNNIMMTPEARMLVVLPINDNTLKLDVNKRFLLAGEDAYKASFRDLTSEPGLMYLTIKADMYNPATDNGSLLIADYYGNSHNYSINILNNNSSIQVGNILQIQANLLDNGNIVSNNTDNITSTWTYVSNNSDIISVDDNGLITPITSGTGSITIGCEGVTSTYNIQVTAIPVAGNFACTISGATSAKLNSAQIYTAVFTNNGNPITDVATWSLTGDDELDTTYATIINTTDTTCTIQITSDYIFGDGVKYIKLHCYGNTATTDTYIRIKLTT